MKTSNVTIEIGQNYSYKTYGRVIKEYMYQTDTVVQGALWPRLGGILLCLELSCHMQVNLIGILIFTKCISSYLDAVERKPAKIL